MRIEKNERKAKRSGKGRQGRRGQEESEGGREVRVRKEGEREGNLMKPQYRAILRYRGSSNSV